MSQSKPSFDLIRQNYIIQRLNKDNAFRTLLPYLIKNRKTIWASEEDIMFCIKYWANISSNLRLLPFIELSDQTMNAVHEILIEAIKQHPQRLPIPRKNREISDLSIKNSMLPILEHTARYQRGTDLSKKHKTLCSMDIIENAYMKIQSENMLYYNNFLFKNTLDGMNGLLTLVHGWHIENVGMRCYQHFGCTAKDHIHLRLEYYTMFELTERWGRKWTRSIALEEQLVWNAANFVQNHKMEILHEDLFYHYVDIMNLNRGWILNIQQKCLMECKRIILDNKIIYSVKHVINDQKKKGEIKYQGKYAMKWNRRMKINYIGKQSDICYWIDARVS